MLTASIQIFSLMQWQACSDVIHFLCLKNSFFETISALFPFFYITRHWISLCDSILFLLNWTGFNLGMKKKIAGVLNSMRCGFKSQNCHLWAVSLSNLSCVLYFSFLKNQDKVSLGLLTSICLKLFSIESGYLRSI